MKRMLKLVYNFVFRTKRRRLTLWALWLSGIARARVRFYPAAGLHRFFGEKGAETPFETPQPEQRRHIWWVSDKVNRVAGRTPWESKCLVRAMVAQRMLRHYRLASTLYLGVGRGEDNKMVAHAWVRCGTFYVTGGDGVDYATVAKFRY